MQWFWRVSVVVIWHRDRATKDGGRMHKKDKDGGRQTIYFRNVLHMEGRAGKVGPEKDHMHTHTHTHAHTHGGILIWGTSQNTHEWKWQHKALSSRIQRTRINIRKIGNSPLFLPWFLPPGGAQSSRVAAKGWPSLQPSAINIR